jgi:hypothetical protein
MEEINTVIPMKVDIYCACIWRHGFEVQTINSLRFQPEFGTATLTLNNYTEDQFEYVQRELSSDDRITIYRGDNAKGSNSKLQYLADGKNPYICLVDNDILYPPDFLAYLIRGCEDFQAMVSLHGVVLNQGLIQSYYRDRTVFRGLKEVIGNIEVDIASNCGSLWKREWFKDYSEWYNQCGNVSMDDLYVSYNMKKAGIKRVVLAHEEGYIRHKEQLPDEYYVFNEYALKPNADIIQTTFIIYGFKQLK